MSNTPKLGELFSRAIDTALNGVNTSIPGRIVEFYPEEFRADIQPLIRKSLPDGSTLDYPTILGVPVQYPSSDSSLIYFPLKRGANVLIVFSQCSTDNWLLSNSNGLFDPADTSKFNLSDAFVIPGINPFLKSKSKWDSQTLTKDPSSVIIKHNVGTADEAEITISSSGEIGLQSLLPIKAKSTSFDSVGDVSAVLGSITMTGLQAQVLTLQAQVAALTAAMALVQAAAATHIHPVTSAPGTTGPAI